MIRPRLSLDLGAQQYAWRQLASRAGVSGSNVSGDGFEELGLPVFYSPPENISCSGPCLIVVPSRADSQWDLLNSPAHSLDHPPVSRILPEGIDKLIESPLPVLFWGEGCEDGKAPFAAIRNNQLIFYADILAATFFMLTRWEETVLSETDQHGRFLATSSAAFRRGFLTRPIIDEYGLVLQAWLEALLPMWRPRLRQFEVKLSHDIDSVRRFRKLQDFIQVLGWKLVKQHSLNGIGETLQEGIAQAMFPDLTSQLQSISQLADLSKSHGMRASFFFMAAGPGPIESDYDVEEPMIKKCIALLQQQGLEIGFHPGYHAFDDPVRLASEKARLDRILGYTHYGGRQHFLRFNPRAWSQWEQVRMTYDSTVGYHDHEGFRCGTCYPYYPFDLVQDRQLGILEYPLIVMDATLRRYRKQSPEDAEVIIIELAKRCRNVGGTFTLLWHNTMFDGNGSPWAELYKRLVRQLADLSRSARIPVGTAGN